MSDEQLMSFCAANNILRVERGANGDVIVMTPTGPAIGERNMDISTDLNLWTRRDGRGKAFNSSTGFTLPDGSMRSADAAWLLNSRWKSLSKEQQRGFAPICPDFVIELRSSSDHLHDLEAKMKLWIANGAQLAWSIDPDNQVVSIYRPYSEPEVLNGPSSVQGTVLQLDSSSFWGASGCEGLLNVTFEYLVARTCLCKASTSGILIRVPQHSLSQSNHADADQSIAGGR